MRAAFAALDREGGGYILEGELRGLLSSLGDALSSTEVYFCFSSFFFFFFDFFFFENPFLFFFLVFLILTFNFFLLFAFDIFFHYSYIPSTVGPSHARCESFRWW